MDFNMLVLIDGQSLIGMVLFGKFTKQMDLNTMVLIDGQSLYRGYDLNEI